MFCLLFVVFDVKASSVRPSFSIESLNKKKKEVPFFSFHFFPGRHRHIRRRRFPSVVNRKNSENIAGCLSTTGQFLPSIDKLYIHNSTHLLML